MAWTREIWNPLLARTGDLPSPAHLASRLLEWDVTAN
jgi:hypothetical protein